MRLRRYIAESEGILDLNSVHIYQEGGYVVNNSKHGTERVWQRNKLSPDELKKLFSEAIGKLKNGAVRVGEIIMFWSKSLKQAFVSKITDPRHIKIITFLPRNKHFISPDSPETQEVVVEGIDMTSVRVVEID